MEKSLVSSKGFNIKAISCRQFKTLLSKRSFTTFMVRKIIFINIFKLFHLAKKMMNFENILAKRIVRLLCVNLLLIYDVFLKLKSWIVNAPLRCKDNSRFQRWFLEIAFFLFSFLEKHGKFFSNKKKPLKPLQMVFGSTSEASASK